jgi:predicted transposase/invertase (TIGR01784 family)
MNIPVFKEYFQNLPDEDRYLMVSYLGACITRKGHSLEKLVTLTSNNTKEKEKMMESIAQEYIDRGKQEGKQEGRQEEKLGIARTMLHQLQLGFEIVQQATGLSRQELARL